MTCPAHDLVAKLLRMEQMLNQLGKEVLTSMPQERRVRAQQTGVHPCEVSDLSTRSFLQELLWVLPYLLESLV